MLKHTKMKGLVDLENNIENEGLESVCNALRNNTRITQLNLSRIKSLVFSLKAIISFQTTRYLKPGSRPSQKCWQQTPQSPN